MACRIKRDNKGKIIKVLEKSNNDSEFVQDLKDRDLYEFMMPVSELDKIKEFDRKNEPHPLKGSDYYNKLKSLIKKYGIRRPIIIKQGNVKGKRGTYELIDEGNHRLAIAKDLGIKEIPVKIRYEDFSDLNSDKAAPKVTHQMYSAIGQYIDNRQIKKDNPPAKESKLFNDIAKLPHVETLEQAVDIYNEIINSGETSENIKEIQKKNFEKWRGNNKEVSGTEIGEVSTGESIVARVYHGTTHNFDEFDADINGSIEGHLGKVNYFTSDYQDASGNYLADGADITGRVENLKEKIVSELESREYETFDEIYDYVLENFPDFDVSSLDETTDFNEVANRVSENQLLGSEEQVMELYVKLNNPVVLGNDTNWIEVVPEKMYENSLEDAVQEIAEDNDISVEEAKEDYYFEIREKAIELEGIENPLIESLQEALDSNGYEDRNALEILGEFSYESEVNLTDIEQKIRNEAELYDNYDGELASSQVVADFFENLGYDGIILNNVSERFQGMNLGETTSHVHVFNKNKNQIKSSEGDNITFDETKENIFYSLQSDGVKYNSFKEALKNTDSNTIDIVSNGKVIASLPSSLDERTSQGIVNSLILDNIIKPSKVTLDGKTYFQVTGETHQEKIVTEEFLKEYLKANLPKDSYTVKSGVLDIHPVKIVESQKGSLHKMVSDRLLDYFSSDTIVKKKDKIDETNLKLNLLTILSDMGVSVVNLKEYQERFKKKSNNIPPSAEALTDVVNRIVAFKEGLLNLDNLTEEVMHLIVETIPQEELSELSDFIKSSSEYQEFYNQYKDVYNDDILLEKEILGKILKNITLEKIEDKDKSFISRLIDIVQRFFDNLLLDSDTKNKLKNLNSIVEKFVIQQEQKFTEDDLSKSREIALMYSLSDQVSNAQGNFQKTFSKLTDFRQFNSYKRELKNISFENLKGRELSTAVSRFIEMSTKLIETTESAINTSKKYNKSISGQNKAILEDLDNEIRSNLSSLAIELDSEQPGIDSIERNKLAEKLRENANKILDLRALNDRTTNDQIKAMAKEITNQMGQAESEFFENQVRKVLEGEIEDTNKIFSFFGQLHHASNPILNLVGSKIWEMNMKANEGIKQDVSEFLNYMEDNKISSKEFESLVKDGYFEDIIDHKAFEDTLLQKEMESFSEISGQVFENIEQYNKAKLEDSLTQLSNEQYGEYKTLLDKKQQPYLEKMMNDTYYKELFEKYDRLKISGATQAFLKENSAQRGAIKANAAQSYIDSEGNKKTRIVLSPQDNDMLNSISKIRKAKKNIYSEVLLLKKGLKLTQKKPDGQSVLLNTGQYLSLNITEDMSQGEKDIANISFDLHKLDNEYTDQLKGKISNSTSEKAKLNFVSYVGSLQENHSEQEVLDIIMSNLDISLSSDFYDTLNGESFLKGDSLNELNPDNKELVENVKELYAKRNAILSMYRNTSSPFEIDKMNSSDQESVRSLTSRISDGLKLLNLPNTSEQRNSAGTKSPNKSYLRELDKKGIKENTQAELEFLVRSQHSNIPQMNRLKNVYYKNASSIPLSDSDALFLSRYKGETLLETQLNYAKDNLQPYYSRFTPTGYKSIEERLNDGQNIVNILNSVFEDKYLSIRIDPSFEEKDNPLKNPNYNDNYDGGFKQPKKGTFINKNFIDKFGINEKGEATKNKKLFEARRLYIEARKRGLAKMNEKGANPYKVIQISKTTTEKVRNLTKGKNKKETAQELLKDAFAYRVDDIAYGEKGFEQSRILPKYYMKDLENPSDVSTDYSYALTQFVSRANEYKAKRDIISDIDALHDVLLRSKRHAKSKDLPNAIEMFESFVDNSIYGKQETLSYQIKVPGTDYSFDLAKISRLITKYISLKNLGYNVTVPLTGYLSGVASKKVEEWIGEKLNKDSSRLASKEYKKLMRDGYSQSLNINDNSKLFLIGQAFGLYDISEKAKNAKYNTFQRTFSKSAMALHTMANYPIVPKIALTVLYDNRIIDGKIFNRQQYFQENTRKGVALEEIEVKWKTAEENAIYNYMDFSKNGFSWTSSIKELIPDENYLNDRKLFMMKFIRSQVSNVDATIPQEMRLTAQRNALGSMVLLHKGFLSIFLQNRFKNRNLNIDSGLLEEGSYRTLGRLTADFFNTKGNMSVKIDNLKKSLKPPSPEASNEEWLEYELNVRNMKRIGKEIGAMGILATLGSLVFAMASDPDNEDIYALQMTSYLTTRLLNESSTAFTPSLLGDLNGVIESPLGVYDSGKEILKIHKLFDGDEITRGKYKGLNQREKWITKNALGVKGLYDIWGADNVSQSEDTYRLYNEENINRGTLGLNSLYKSFYKN